jgi:hypothetical protein
VIARFEQRRDDVRIDRQQSRPDPLENSFDVVREFRDRAETDHGRGSF